MAAERMSSRNGQGQGAGESSPMSTVPEDRNDTEQENEKII